MQSGPENPFLFTFDGKVPALKNGKMVHWVEDANGKLTPKVYSNKEVQDWYEGQRGPLLAQLAAQSDLDPILGFSKKKVHRRACCRFEIFSNGGLSSLDGDNMYTTVQDLLQIPSKATSKRKHKGILGIVDTDRWVQDHSVAQRPIFDIRCAYLWVWEIPEELMWDDLAQLQIWQTHREDNLHKRIGKKKLTLPPSFFKQTSP